MNQAAATGTIRFEVTGIQAQVGSPMFPAVVTGAIQGQRAYVPNTFHGPKWQDYGYLLGKRVEATFIEGRGNVVMEVG